MKRISFLLIKKVAPLPPRKNLHHLNNEFDTQQKLLKHIGRCASDGHP